MAAVNGTVIAITDGGTEIASTTSCTLNVEMDLPDASTKDSSGWAEHIRGQKSWSIDLDGVAEFESSANVDDLVNHILDRDAITVEFIPDVAEFSGAIVKYSGTASMASISVVAAMEDTVTLSGSMTGTGALTRTAIS